MATSSVVMTGTTSMSAVASSVATTALSTTLSTLTTAVLTLATTNTTTARAASATFDGDPALSGHGDDSNSPGVSNYHEPFYSSSFPICYALAASTVTSYMLLIMLFITPRSFLDGGVVYLGRQRGFTHSSSGGENIGGRPWLQKIAALGVVISLTIATVDTFKVAATQYSLGAQNGKFLQRAVMGSVELRAIRLVSNTFLWLAQAQTLIRLFPRHREKIIIKWAAFALILLDLIFSGINSFEKKASGYANGNPWLDSNGFDHPIQALSYMFQLLLGVLYAAWVLYYAIMKKRYAFYHPLMKNMPLLAMVSMAAILIPIVFFIMDICRPKFTGWGDYVRWVGAAGASVIVWEWVERIEALEREEKKGGILGREVFDGDDVLEVSASDYPWDRHNKGSKGNQPGRTGGGGTGASIITARRVGDESQRNERQSQPQSNGWPGVAATLTGLRRNHGHENGVAPEMQENVANNGSSIPGSRIVGGILRPHWPARPVPAATPVSRTDSPSAASTVYAVHYQTPEPTGRTPDPFSRSTPDPRRRTPDTFRAPQANVQPSEEQTPPVGRFEGSPPQQGSSPPTEGQIARAVDQTGTTSTDHEGNRTTTPASVGGQRSSAAASNHRSVNTSSRSSLPAASTFTPSSLAIRRRAPERDFWSSDDRESRWDIKTRLEMFAASQADKIREKLRPTADTDALPVTVIPAPSRQGAALQQVLEEDEISPRPPSSDSDADEQLQQHTDAGDDAEGNWSNSNNPPLWPGVRRRLFTYAEDESSYDEDDEDEEEGEDEGDSASDSGASAHDTPGHGSEPGHSRRAGS